jgi:hypothetical protein
MTRKRLIAILAGLAVLDLVVPLPILGLALLWVVLERPPWFLRLVDEVYGARA